MALEFDDFHWASPENCLPILERLVDFCPQIKITLFTVPMLRQQPLWIDSGWCDRVRLLCDQGNIELARHGFLHSQEEFKHYSLDDAKKMLLLGDRCFVESRLPYVKVFRGPHWGINEHAVDALNQLGYSHLYNHVSHANIARNFAGRVVYYNWNLQDEHPPFRLLIAHGHTHNVCGNGIGEVESKIRRFIMENNPEFQFCSEI